MTIKATISDENSLITKLDSIALLNHITEGVIHKHEVKKCRTDHFCWNTNCPKYGFIDIGEPAITITNEVINQYTQRPVFTKPKYYHVSCEPQ